MQSRVKQRAAVEKSELWAVQAVESESVLCRYLNKDQVAEEILKAIRQVLAGDWYFSPELLKRLAVRAMGNEIVADDPLAKLSDRELQVFQLMGQGLDAKTISAMLHLETSTVETHRRRIREKFNLPTTTALMFKAFTWSQDWQVRQPQAHGDSAAES